MIIVLAVATRRMNRQWIDNGLWRRPEKKGCQARVRPLLSLNLPCPLCPPSSLTLPVGEVAENTSEATTTR
jgi:hypothetical protein